MPGRILRGPLRGHLRMTGSTLSVLRIEALMSVVKWDREADVVVIGTGATGFPAAIVAREAGASVIMIEAENHVGGHAITSGGNLPLGGGTALPEEIRHRGFARPVLPRSDRLVGGRAQRLSALPLQRPRDHPRLRRQQRADLRIPAGARRESHRPASRTASAHEIGDSVLRTMQISVAGLADGPYRRTGRARVTTKSAPAPA